MHWLSFILVLEFLPLENTENVQIWDSLLPIKIISPLKCWKWNLPVNYVSRGCPRVSCNKHPSPVVAVYFKIQGFAFFTLLFAFASKWLMMGLQNFLLLKFSIYWKGFLFYVVLSPVFYFIVVLYIYFWQLT